MALEGPETGSAEIGLYAHTSGKSAAIIMMVC